MYYNVNKKTNTAIETIKGVSTWEQACVIAVESLDDANEAQIEKVDIFNNGETSTVARMAAPSTLIDQIHAARQMIAIETESHVSDNLDKAFAILSNIISDLED